MTSSYLMGIRSELMSAVGLVLILPGLSLLLLGARRTRLSALPLLIAAMMLPIPAGRSPGSTWRCAT